MVTPNCNTAVNALVIYETSFRKKLLPKLYNIDIPILSKNNEPGYYYIHEMEEGIIDSKYEIEES